MRRPRLSATLPSFSLGPRTASRVSGQDPRAARSEARGRALIRETRSQVPKKLVEQAAKEEAPEIYIRALSDYEDAARTPG